MAKIADKLRTWWYSPAPPQRLGIIRFAVGAFTIWYIFARRLTLARVARTDADLYDPVGLFRVLGTPMDPVAYDWLVWITLISGVLFTVGALYRYAGPVFSIALGLTLMYRNSWSMIYHMNNALLVHAVILGFTRAADGFSIDRYVTRSSPFGAPTPHADYGWPISLLCAVTASGYLLAGVAKLSGPQGWAWMWGDVLREQIAVDTIRKELLEGYGMPLCYLLWDQVWIFTALGIGTYILELGAPLFLIGGKTRRAWAVSTWMMHVGIYLIMGIKFRYQLSFVIFLPFFHVERLLTLTRFVRHRQPDVLIPEARDRS